MYTIITINPDKQDPEELSIWTENLKSKNWQFSEHFQGACWKKFEKGGHNAYKEEFDAAVVQADLVKDHYIVSYSDAAPLIEILSAY